MLVGWRGGSFPGEPTRIRPAIVIEDAALFPGYVNMLVVPITRDNRFIHALLAVRIDPTPENGADAVCWALSHHVTSVSMQRVRATTSRVTDDQLSAIRERVGLAVGGFPDG